MANYSLMYNETKNAWGIACNGNLDPDSDVWDDKKAAQVICDAFNRSERRAARKVAGKEHEY